MNQAILIGNITEDPKIRYTQTGKKVANFNMATNETYVRNGEQKQATQYHRCVAWENLADTVNGLGKGSPVVVVGKITTRSYEQNGEKRYITEIQCSSVSTYQRQQKGDFSKFGTTQEDVPF